MFFNKNSWEYKPRWCGKAPIDHWQYGQHSVEKLYIKGEYYERQFCDPANKTV